MLWAWSVHGEKAKSVPGLVPPMHLRKSLRMKRGSYVTNLPPASNTHGERKAAFDRESQRISHSSSGKGAGRGSRSNARCA